LKKYSISIVVPVYSGAETITPLVERLEAVLAPICNDFEVILVNDGSPDNSWQVISQLGQRYPWLRGINLMRNYGQHNATLCGVREAHGEITVTMDDDLQHPPRKIRCPWPSWKRDLMWCTVFRKKDRIAGGATGFRWSSSGYWPR
jgi:undecaprenyl-phosphate 4-deoxy-4-formamido-L-arabinose transferase